MSGCNIRWVAFALLILLCPWKTALGNSNTIAWNPNIREAIVQASESNKPILLDFWASWCNPCLQMDKNVYSNPKIIAAVTRSFVPVRIDFDGKQDLDQLYGVKNLPTMIFADSHGMELFRHAGYMNVDEFMRLLADFPKDISQINSLEQLIKADSHNLQALYALAGELAHSGLYLMSNQYYDRALKIEEEPERKAVILAFQGFNYIALKDSKDSEKLFLRCLKDFPSSPSKPAFLLGLGQSYELSGNRNKAKQTFTTLVNEYPSSKFAQTAQNLLNQLR